MSINKEAYSWLVFMIMIFKRGYSGTLPLNTYEQPSLRKPGINIEIVILLCG